MLVNETKKGSFLIYRCITIFGFIKQTTLYKYIYTQMRTVQIHINIRILRLRAWNNRCELMITCKYPFVRLLQKRMSNPRRKKKKRKKIAASSNPLVHIFQLYTWTLKSHVDQIYQYIFSHLLIFRSIVQYIYVIGQWMVMLLRLLFVCLKLHLVGLKNPTACEQKKKWEHFELASSFQRTIFLSCLQVPTYPSMFTQLLVLSFLLNTRST